VPRFRIRGALPPPSQSPSWHVLTLITFKPISLTEFKVLKVSSSHGAGYEKPLLEYDAVKSRKNLKTFLRKILPSFSRSHVDFLEISTRLDGMKNWNVILQNKHHFMH
jgi:hypothetical protein